jgi:hypothetical protein
MKSSNLLNLLAKKFDARNPSQSARTPGDLYAAKAPASSFEKRAAASYKETRKAKERREKERNEAAIATLSSGRYSDATLLEYASFGDEVCSAICRHALTLSPELISYIVDNSYRYSGAPLELLRRRDVKFEDISKMYDGRWWNSETFNLLASHPAATGKELMGLLFSAGHLGEDAFNTLLSHPNAGPTLRLKVLVYPLVRAAERHLYPLGKDDERQLKKKRTITAKFVKGLKSLKLSSAEMDLLIKMSSDEIRYAIAHMKKLSQSNIKNLIKLGSNDVKTILLSKLSKKERLNSEIIKYLERTGSSPAVVAEALKHHMDAGQKDSLLLTSYKSANIKGKSEIIKAPSTPVSFLKSLLKNDKESDPQLEIFIKKQIKDRLPAEPVFFSLGGIDIPIRSGMSSAEEALSDLDAMRSAMKKSASEYYDEDEKWWRLTPAQEGEAPAFNETFKIEFPRDYSLGNDYHSKYEKWSKSKDIKNPLELYFIIHGQDDRNLILLKKLTETPGRLHQDISLSMVLAASASFSVRGVIDPTIIDERDYYDYEKTRCLDKRMWGPIDDRAKNSPYWAYFIPSADYDVFSGLVHRDDVGAEAACAIACTLSRSRNLSAIHLFTGWRLSTMPIELQVVLARSIGHISRQAQRDTLENFFEKFLKIENISDLFWMELNIEGDLKSSLYGLAYSHYAFPINSIDYENIERHSPQELSYMLLNPSMTELTRLEILKGLSSTLLKEPENMEYYSDPLMLLGATISLRDHFVMRKYVEEYNNLTPFLFGLSYNRYCFCSELPPEVTSRMFKEFRGTKGERHNRFLRQLLYKPQTSQKKGVIELCEDFSQDDGWRSFDNKKIYELEAFFLNAVSSHRNGKLEFRYHERTY